MKKLLLKLSPTAKRIAPVLTVVLLLIQIPNQGIALLGHLPTLHYFTGAS